MNFASIFLSSKKISLSNDVFSSGQIESKLWLCREVEKLLKDQGQQTIWVLGGWVGILSFLLLSREQLDIKNIYSFDQDSYCEKMANVINENWIWKNSIFKAKTIDCNKLSYTNCSDFDEPSLIINSAVEHFDSNLWYSNIPKGKIVVLQACDMKHKEHVSCIHSEKKLKNKFPAQKIYYSGSLKFQYTTWGFVRYMLIVEK